MSIKYFYHPIVNQQTFLKEFLNIKETLDHLKQNNRIIFLDEAGTDLHLSIQDVKYKSKRLKGLREDTSYFQFDCIPDNMDMEMEYSADSVLSSLIDEWPEGVFFEKPIVMNKYNGQYYSVIGIGMTAYFSISMIVKKYR